MKRNIKFLIVGIIILLVLLVIMFFLLFKSSKNKITENDSSNVKQTESISKILDKTPNDVKFIVVKNKSGNFSIDVDYSDNEQPFFKIKEVEPQEVSQSILKAFIDELVNLTPSKIVEDQAEDLEKYGLKDSASSINIAFKDGSHKLIKLGNEAPLSLGNYLSLDEEKKVYLLPSYNTEIFNNPKEYYLENKS